MKRNIDKCHLLVSRTKDEHSSAKISDYKIWESNEVKLLDVTIDNKLKFDSHIANIFFKTNQKLSVLSRLTSLLTFDRKRILFKVIFESQFKYCPLIWKFFSRRAWNKLHERALRLLYNYETSFLLDLLATYDSFTVHHTNIHMLLLEMYNYNLRSQSYFGVPGISAFFMVPIQVGTLNQWYGMVFQMI